MQESAKPQRTTLLPPVAPLSHFLFALSLKDPSARRTHSRAFRGTFRGHHCRKHRKCTTAVNCHSYSGASRSRLGGAAAATRPVCPAPSGEHDAGVRAADVSQYALNHLSKPTARHARLFRWYGSLPLPSRGWGSTAASAAALQDEERGSLGRCAALHSGLVQHENGCGCPVLSVLAHQLLVHHGAAGIRGAHRVPPLRFQASAAHSLLRLHIPRSYRDVKREGLSSRPLACMDRALKRLCCIV